MNTNIGSLQCISLEPVPSCPTELFPQANTWPISVNIIE